VQEFFIEGNYPKRETIAEVYRHLRDSPGLVAASAKRIQEHVRSTRNGMAVEAAVRLLEENGIILRERAGVGGGGGMELASLRFDDLAVAAKTVATLRAGAVRAVLATLMQMADDDAEATARFNAEQIAAALNYSPSTVAAALSEIREKIPCTYTPAYRGSRAQVLMPDLDPDRLPIDFVTLAKRADMERLKLETVVNFARLDGCRRKRLLTYFGERADAECGRCDSCRGGTGAASGRTAPPEPIELKPPTGEDAFTAARKMLACVARAEEAGRTVGKAMIVRTLLGSQDQKLKDLGLDRISTYGLLRKWDRAALNAMMTALLDAECLRTETLLANRPILKLTDKGWRVMQNKERIEVRLLARPVDSDGDDGPPALVQRSSAPSDASASAEKAEPPRKPAPPVPASHLTTVTMVKEGLSPEEIAERRGLAPSTVETHITRALEAGLIADIRPFVTEKLETVLRGVLERHGELGFKDVLQHCPIGTTYLHLRCVRIAMNREGKPAGAGA
jgi:ATP-dependent DNA helicase RecQ